MAAALLVLAIGYGLFAPARFVPSDIAMWFVLVAVTLGVVGLAGDLVPGEFRRGQFRFLQRSPTAMRDAWFAKILVLYGGLAALACAGYLCGMLCHELAGGDTWNRTPSFDDLRSVTLLGRFAVATCVAAPWMLAVSCWSHRPTTVVPLGLLVVGLASVPGLLVVAWYRAPVSEGLVWSALSLAFAFGLLASRAAFVGGLRFGSRWSSILRTLPGVFAFTIPVVVWSVDRRMTFYDASRSLEGVQIQGVLVAEGGRQALVTLNRWGGQQFPQVDDGAWYSVVLDLETTGFTQIGEANCYWGETADAMQGQGVRGRPRRFRSHYTVEDLAARRFEIDVFDTRTMRSLEREGFHGDRAPRALRDAIEEDARSSSGLVLPDGTRTWVAHATVLFEDPTGSRDAIEFPAGDFLSSSLFGYGAVWRHGSEGFDQERLFDFTRRETIDLPAGACRNLHRTYVREGEWILPLEGDPGERQVLLFDPERGSTRTWSLPDDAHAIGRDHTGCLFATVNGRIWLFDPSTDTRQHLMVDGVRVEEIEWIDQCDLSYAATPAGDEILRISLGTRDDRTVAHAKLAAGRLIVGPRIRGNRAVFEGVLDDDRFLVLVDRRVIELHRFGDAARTVVFGAPVDSN
ncbi:MAG: hypothetical protein KDB80_13300 [Planctomycetes bacterium]|nr:hypothetical protein [Planctomycetota bacterium]